MQNSSNFDRREALLFVICTVLYALICFGWLAFPVVATAEGTVSLADSDMSFVRGTIDSAGVASGAVPLLGELPPQSISKLVVSAGLYLVALVYGLLVIATSTHRTALMPIFGIGVLTFLAWSMLNFWVIAGFLNANAVLVYGALSIVLLLAWGGGVMSFVSRYHDAMAVFMVRYGLGLALFSTIVQVVAVLTPEWRSPTQGVPVLYNLTFNALVGIFIAGVGGNMLWRERRQELLTAASKRR